ncbi:MAG: MFS transporter, partial [Pseudomonadales bacterium]|nr:MFS transporter [Pseudomonadales bacterium]
GSLAIVQAIMLSGAGLVIGLMMRSDAGSFHWLYPLAAVLGLLGAALYGKVRMRGHSALLRAEHEDRAGRRVAVTPAELWRILISDKSFREYMGAMFVFGIGNLSVKAPLVIILKDRFGFGYLEGILIMQTIPYAMIPIAVPFWSRLFDRMHIVEFRSIHCWSFMSANVLFLIAAMTGSAWLLFVAAACMGIGFGGGILGWNLGHHAFTTTLNASKYMGVHVTLTGLRGLIGPLIAVWLYNAFEAMAPGAGPWVLAVCIGLTFFGAAGFYHLRGQLRREREEAMRAIEAEPTKAEVDEADDGAANESPHDERPAETGAASPTVTARE